MTRLQTMRIIWDHEYETRVRNGFPVIVWIDVAGDRDEGEWHEWVVDYEITNPSGGQVKWLKLTRDESDDLMRAAFRDFKQARKIADEIF